MPTELPRPHALAAGQLRPPRPGLRDAALAIIAALILILHVAASAVLADPLAHVAPDGDATCSGDAKPPAPALPFD
jgi:hypothetical protein